MTAHWQDILMAAICAEIEAQRGKYLHEVRVVVPVAPGETAASGRRLEHELAKIGLDGVYVRVEAGSGPPEVVAYRFEDGFAG